MTKEFFTALLVFKVDSLSKKNKKVFKVYREYEYRVVLISSYLSFVANEFRIVLTKKKDSATDADKGWC